MRLLIIVPCALVTSCSEPIDGSFSYWTYVTHARDYERVNEVSNLDPRAASKRCVFVARAADSLIAHIEFLEKVLLDSAGQADPRQWKGPGAPDMERLLSVEPATSILIGNPSAPDTGPNSGECLRQHIEHYGEVVGGMAPACRAYLYSGDLMDASGILNRWVNVRFYHLPLIAVLDELNSLKTQVRIAEIQGLRSCQ